MTTHLIVAAITKQNLLNLFILGVVRHPMHCISARSSLTVDATI